jgi:rsbT co-antagonist protein RsbR
MTDERTPDPEVLALRARVADLERLLLEERASSRARREARRRFFERVFTGRALSDTLEALAEAIEAEMDQARCSILLLDAEGKRLLHGAAPSLPRAYNEAIHGVEIGPMVGSCGSAAALGQTVIVTDIEHDPRWAPYKDLALGFGLRACWSVPVRDKHGKVIGTFAFYYGAPRAPTEEERAAIEGSACLAAVAVERARTLDELHEARERLQRFVSSSPMMFMALDENGVCTYVDGQLTERLPAERPRIGESIFEGVTSPEVAAYLRRALAGEVLQAVHQVGDRFFEAWYRPVLDASGKSNGLIAIISDISERRRAEAEAQRLQEEIIRMQAETLAELSTPLIPVRDDVLVMPLVGAIDEARAERVLQTLLSGIVERAARFALLDITGVRVVDAQVAEALVRTARAAELVGARVILTGLRPGVAKTLVELGVDLGSIVTRGTLQSGIAFAEGGAGGRQGRP